VAREAAPLRRALLAAGSIAAVAVAGGCGFSLLRLWTPADPSGAERSFQVSDGESLAAVVRALDEAALLPDPWPLGEHVLLGWARVRGVDRAVKSGEYELSARMRPVEILSKLVAGEVKTYAVTLPEGLRLDEIAARLEAAGIVEASALLAQATSSDVARALGVAAPSLEGYLHPETYRFPRRAKPEDVLRELVAQSSAQWGAADDARARELGLTRHQAITLASIVEKETGLVEERPLISAVFHNRLRLGMRLQSDPTVIYGVYATRGSFDGNLRREDLERDTPWNTYTRAGLPPGPISSAGREALRAVLEPAPVPYLYFVARNDGSHVFSATLEEHVRAVNRYQRSRPTS
jgi:UPF0755 protein